MLHKKKCLPTWLPGSKLRDMDTNSTNITIEAYLGLELSPQRISSQDVANALGIHRNTYAKRQEEGRVSADDVIAVMRHYGLNPTRALEVMGYLEAEEIEAAMPDFTRTKTRKEKRVKRKLDTSEFGE